MINLSHVATTKKSSFAIRHILRMFRLLYDNCGVQIYSSATRTMVNSTVEEMKLEFQMSVGVVMSEESPGP